METMSLLTVLELQAEQCQAKHQPELHGRTAPAEMERVWSGEEGSKDKQIRVEASPDLPGLDYQLHPTDSQTETKRGEKNHFPRYYVSSLLSGLKRKTRILAPSAGLQRELPLLSFLSISELFNRDAKM